MAEEAGGGDAAELGIDAVGGVFVVLGFGCLFALIVAILEFLWNVKKVAIEEKVCNSIIAQIKILYYLRAYYQQYVTLVIND